MLEHNFDQLQKLFSCLCIVDIEKQNMEVYGKNNYHKNFLISTAAIGINNKINSYGTPIGEHEICEKIGQNADLFTIFKSRQNTYKICNTLNVNTKEDLILTRILRLKGKEPGINNGFNSAGVCVDSYKRNIYIHGTNREDLLGTPASKGCIRMNNIDIVNFFNNIEIGAKVFIVKNREKLSNYIL